MVFDGGRLGFSRFCERLTSCFTFLLISLPLCLIFLFIVCLPRRLLTWPPGSNNQFRTCCTSYFCLPCVCDVCWRECLVLTSLSVSICLHLPCVRAFYRACRFASVRVRVGGREFVPRCLARAACQHIPLADRVSTILVAPAVLSAGDELTLYVCALMLACMLCSSASRGPLSGVSPRMGPTV